MSTALKSRFRKLLFAKEGKEAHADEQLKNKPDPKPALRQPIHIPGAEIREDIPWANSVRRCRSREDRGNGPQHLRGDERESDMDSCQGLEKNHAEADALDSIQHTQP